MIFLFRHFLIYRAIILCRLYTPALVHVFFILAFCYSKKVSKGYFLYPCRERLTSTHFSNSPLKAQFNWNFYGHSFFILQVLTLGNVTMGACFKGGTWIGFNILGRCSARLIGAGFKRQEDYHQYVWLVLNDFPKWFSLEVIDGILL